MSTRHKRVSVSAAQAKAQFSSLMAEVAYGGKHVIIERRGKPVAALVSATDLEYLEQRHATLARPQGALAMHGRRLARSGG
jgi:prevent-host-death family protein